MSGFHCQRLSKEFYAATGPVAALSEIDLTVDADSFVCLVGPSGCGKSTLLRLISGLLKPTSGVISFDRERPDGRLRTALVFQEHAIFPWMTVLDNVAFGLEAMGVEAHLRRLQALSLLERVHLTDFAHHYPHQLSGGMKQRVGVARAFLSDPDILLMDEPFGSLDAQTRLLLQEELLSIWRDQQKTVVYVTHDIDEAILLGDRVLVMSGRPGRILADMPVPLGRPRTLAAADSAELKEIKWQIWKMLEQEVRASLSQVGSQGG